MQSLGLTAKSWPQVLDGIKAKLPAPDWEKFSRLHKNFASYRSTTTLYRFYGFVFSHGLQWDINCFRYARLAGMLADLLPEIRPGQTILDVGAGAGIVATLIQRHCAPGRLELQDVCEEARAELKAQGFKVLPNPPPDTPLARFDLILCMDSLGEINSDDDGALALPSAAEDPDYPAQLEERYGFAQKLAAWKNHLAPSGRILLWEPFAYQNAMEGVAGLLRQAGWNARLIAHSPKRNYLDLGLP